MTRSETADFRVTPVGSKMEVTCLTKAAQDFCDALVSPMKGDHREASSPFTFTVEPRMLEIFLDGLRANGFLVVGTFQRTALEGKP